MLCFFFFFIIGHILVLDRQQFASSHLEYFYGFVKGVGLIKESRALLVSYPGSIL